MTRITAGSERGRRLAVPSGLDVRPTPSKVREALFNILAAVVPGARILDLYAGAGTLGIEALSRGAAHCTFVDRASRALSVLRRNLEQTGLMGRARVLKRNLPDQIGRAFGGPFDVVLSDPPYATDPVAEIAKRLLESPELLAPRAVWAHEGPGKRAKAGADYELDGWEQTDLRRYGDTAIWLFRRTSA